MRRTAEILQTLRLMDSKLERLDVAIITRYPDSERAADNYDALRKALIVGGSAASRHVSDLLPLLQLWMKAPQLKPFDSKSTTSFRSWTSPKFRSIRPARFQSIESATTSTWSATKPTHVPRGFECRMESPHPSGRATSPNFP